MDFTQEAKQHLKGVASETLDQFEKVAAAAKSKLLDPHVPGPGVLANVNTIDVWLGHTAAGADHARKLG